MRRNVKELVGYTIHATDGDIGVLDGLYFDDAEWTIRYMVVNTGKWLPGRKVLIVPLALQQPNWKAQSLPVALTKEQIRNSPGIDTAKLVSRQHETDWHAYYGWPIYWGVPTYPAPGSGITPAPAVTIGVMEKDELDSE